MIKDQCISVTDLRTKTKKCLKGLNKAPKYVFINNKPVAVIIDITKYEKYFHKPELIELKENQVDETLVKEASAAQEISKDKLVDI
jgi:hypothetical protein